MKDDYLSIGQLSKETGVSAHTLRYYGRLGLLPDTERTLRGNHRRFSRRFIGWVAFVRRLREAGMSVRSIADYVELLDEGEAESWPARRQLLAAHREEVKRKIGELQEHLTILDQKLKHGCGPESEMPDQAFLPGTSGKQGET